MDSSVSGVLGQLRQCHLIRFHIAGQFSLPWRHFSSGFHRPISSDCFVSPFREHREFTVRDTHTTSELSEHLGLRYLIREGTSLNCGTFKTRLLLFRRFLVGKKGLTASFCWT